MLPSPLLSPRAPGQWQELDQHPAGAMSTFPGSPMLSEHLGFGPAELEMTESPCLTLYQLQTLPFVGKPQHGTLRGIVTRLSMEGGVWGADNAVF